MRTVGSHRAMRTARREAEAQNQIDRLARFSAAPLTDPVAFGGGSEAAVVNLRAQTVAYGYLGVVEQYAHPTTGIAWCTLSVTLPNEVPFLALDHRTAFGQWGVPVAGGFCDIVGDADFDAAYITTADNELVIDQLVTAELRNVLICWSVQRLMFSGARLLIRTFDGFTITPDVTEWLDAVAAAVLAATPGFVTRVMSPDAGPVGRPFPPGLYGPNE
jgi:hypothetical protein